MRLLILPITIVAMIAISPMTYADTHYTPTHCVTQKPGTNSPANTSIDCQGDPDYQAVSFTLLGTVQNGNIKIDDSPTMPSIPVINGKVDFHSDIYGSMIGTINEQLAHLTAIPPPSIKGMDSVIADFRADS